MGPMRLFVRRVEEFRELSGDKGTFGEEYASYAQLTKDREDHNLEAKYAIQDTPESRLKEERTRLLLRVIKMKNGALFGPSQTGQDTS